MLRFKQFLLEDKFEDWIDNPDNNINSSHDEGAKNLSRNEIANKIMNHIPKRNQGHFEWAVDKYNKGRMKLEDLPVLQNALSKYGEYQSKLKPLKNYSEDNEAKFGDRTYLDHNQLHNAVTALDTEKRTANENLSKKRIAEGSKIVHNSPNMTIYHVHTPEASCELSKTPDGKPLPWCTAVTDKKGNPSSGNMFDHYKSQSNNRFFVIHNHKEQYPYRRIGYAIGTNQLQDENNTKIEGDDLKALSKRNPELRESGVMNGVSTEFTKNPNDYIHELLDNDFKGVEENKDKLNKDSLHTFEDFKHNLAKSLNSNIPKSDSDQLKNSRYTSIRKNLAIKSRDQGLLTHLANDIHPDVRSSVGSNINTPENIREQLISSDPNPQVRKSIPLDSFPRDKAHEIFDNEPRTDVKVSHVNTLLGRLSADDELEDNSHEFLDKLLSDPKLSSSHLSNIIKAVPSNLTTKDPEKHKEIADKLINHKWFDKLESDDDGKQTLLKDRLSHEDEPENHPKFDQLNDKSELLFDNAKFRPDRIHKILSSDLIKHLTPFHIQSLIDRGLRQKIDPKQITDHILNNQSTGKDAVLGATNSKLPEEEKIRLADHPHAKSMVSDLVIHDPGYAKYIPHYLRTNKGKEIHSSKIEGILNNAQHAPEVYPEILRNPKIQKHIKENPHILNNIYNLGSTEVKSALLPHLGNNPYQ